MSSPLQRIRLKLVTTAAALVAISLVWSGGTFSAFNATSSMPGNSVAAASVNVTANDGGSALLSFSGARPGDSSTPKCENVTYTSAAAARMRIYGTTSGSLAPYLTLTVTRGTFSGTPSAGSCTGFTADSTDWIGSGAGVIYSGTLSAFPSTSGTAIIDPTSGSAASWSSGDKHGYKFTLTLPSNVSSAAQGLSASASFTWQAVTT